MNIGLKNYETKTMARSPPEESADAFTVTILPGLGRLS